MHSKFLEYLVEELGPEFSPSEKPDKRASLTMHYSAGPARLAITLEMKTDTKDTEQILGIFAKSLANPMGLLDEEHGAGFGAACDRAWERLLAYLNEPSDGGGI